MRPHVATAIVVHVILRELNNPRRIQRKRAQVLLVHRSLHRIHRANFHMRESRLLFGKGNRCQKIAEPLQHVFFTKFFQPKAQVSLVRHAAIIPEWERAEGKREASRRKIAVKRVISFSVETRRPVPAQSQWKVPEVALSKCRPCSPALPSKSRANASPRLWRSCPARSANAAPVWSQKPAARNSKHSRGASYRAR